MKNTRFLKSFRQAGFGLVWLGLAYGCQSNSKTEEKAATTEAANAQLVTAAPAPLFVRRNAHDPAAQPDLEALSKALAIMKNMDCDNPISWYYQSAIHNTPINIVGALTKNPYCPAFVHGSAPKLGWDGCTHGGGEMHFLIWHRLYTAHFERIVRKLSGKPDFAMPYWDYTNTKSGYRQMPAIFRAPTDSLFTLARYTPLNQGAAIEAKMNAILDTAKIFNYATFSDFNQNIDGIPHGQMHNYIGCGAKANPPIVWNRIYQLAVDGGFMGNVESAAFDPIFWVHHANIDYLWETWAQSRKKKPDLALLKANPWPYLFMDENGKPVKYSVDSAYAAAMNPDYRYNVLPGHATNTKLMATATPQENAPVALATVNVARAIKANTTFAAVLPVTAQRSGMLKSAVPGAKVNRQRLLLEVEVSFVKAPRSSYTMYVRNKGTAGLLAANPHLAGIMSFFGADHQHGAAHKMPGMEMPADKFSKTFRFDVTDEMNAATFDGNLDVQVVPDSPDAPAITIEKLTLLTRAL